MNIEHTVNRGFGVQSSLDDCVFCAGTVQGQIDLQIQVSCQVFIILRSNNR